MESERRSSHAGSVVDGLSVKPKKRNQMNTGIKGLRLAVKGKNAKGMANSLMSMTGIKQVAHSVADKLARLTANENNDKGKKEIAKIQGLVLGLNGKTALETFLLGLEVVEGGKKKRQAVASTGEQKTTLLSKGKWEEKDLDIAQGVLSGEAERRQRA